MDPHPEKVFTLCLIVVVAGPIGALFAERHELGETVVPAGVVPDLPGGFPSPGHLGKAGVVRGVQGFCGGFAAAEGDPPRHGPFVPVG